MSNEFYRFFYENACCMCVTEGILFVQYCTVHNKKQFELVVASEKKVVSRVVPLAGQAYRLEDHIAPNLHITQSFTKVSANFWIVGSVVVCR